MNEILNASQLVTVKSIDIFKQLGYAQHRLLKRLVSKNKSLFSEELFSTYRFCTENKGRGRSDKSYLFGFKDLLTLISISKNNNKNSSIKSSVIKSLVQSVETASLIAIIDTIKNLDVEEVEADKYVYVAKEERTGRYKIGISKFPGERIKQLNTGNPEQLILVHAYLATEQRHLSETLAHSIFSDDRLKGEWFKETINLNLLPSYAVDI